MKEDKEHIDNLFKESLEQRTFEIPDAFMADLNARLDAVQSNRKKRFPFFLFLPAIIAIGASLAVWLFNSQKEVSRPIHPEQTAHNGILTNTHSEEQSGSDPSGQTYTQQAKATEIHSSGKKAPINSETNNNNNNNNKQIHETNGASDKHKTIKTGQKTTSETLQNNKLETNSTKKIKISGKTKSKGKTSVKTGKTKNTDGSGTQPKGSGAMNTEKTGGKNPQEPGNKEKTENPEKTAQNTEQPPADPGKEQNAAAVKDSVSAADSSAAVAAAPSPVNEIQSADSKKWRYEIQFYGGIGANKIHESGSNKLNEQQSILAPSFGINGNASFKQFTFGTGLSYMQTGEKFKAETYTYSLKDSTYSEIIYDTTWVFDSITGWTPVISDTTIYHTTQVPDSASQSNAIKNQYSWFSIPVSFGYRFELGKYELIPRIGAQFNIGLGKNNGRYPTQNLTNLATYPAVRFNVSYIIQLEARRNFDNWHIFVNPYFKSMISPAVSGDVIRRKYSSWGIQFGVGISL